MKTKIIPIGNSQGIRIPKPLLEEAGLGDEVDLTVERGTLIIRSSRRPRAGWDTAFKQMAEQGDDALLDDVPTSLTEWDEKEWQW